MYGTSLWCQQRVFRVAVGLILLHGILHGLSRIVVLQFHRYQGQAVERHHQVNAVIVLLAICQLFCDAEDVLPIQLLCRGIQFRWQRIVHIEEFRDKPESLAQHVSHATIGQLFRQFREELSFRILIGKAPRVLHLFLLSGEQEPLHPLCVQSVVFHIVVARSLFKPLLVPKISKNHVFEVHFTHICRHCLYLVLLSSLW